MAKFGPHAAQNDDSMIKLGKLSRRCRKDEEDDDDDVEDIPEPAEVLKKKGPRTSVTLFVNHQNM